MNEVELAQLQRQVQRERTARKEAERLLEEKSLALYRANQELQRESDHSRLLLDSIVEGAYGVNLEGTCTFVNASCLRMLGYQNGDELLGKHMHTLTHHSHSDGSPYPASECKVYLVYHTLQKIKVSDEVFWRKDGSSFPVEYWSNPILVDGAVVGAIATFTDISERKRTDEAMRISAQRYQLLFESSRDALMTLAPPSWKFTSANQAALQLFGAPSLAEFTALGPGDVSPERQPDGRSSSEKAQETIATAMREGTHCFEWEHQRLDGQTFAADVLLTRMKPSGEVFLQATVRDISERKRTEEALRASEVRFKLIFNEAPLGIALIDSLTGHIYSVNPIFAKIVGRTMEEMTHIDWISITHPDDVQKDLDNMALLNAGKISGFQMEKRYLHHDGSPIWVNMTIAPIYVEDKAHPRHLCMIEDITERKQMEDQVRQLAFHDPLTKLPNRRLVNDRLNQTMAVSKRSGCYGALMFLDLDNFKPINDTHGHAAGDLLLIEVADRLKCCVREMDTVGRVGGDEFVVMLSDLNADKAEAASQAEIVAEKIRIKLSEPYLLTIKHEGKADTTVEHHCTASIGVTLFINHEASQDDILKQADTAMYQAKETGRNQVRFYE